MPGEMSLVHHRQCQPMSLMRFFWMEASWSPDLCNELIACFADGPKPIVVYGEIRLLPCKSTFPT
jgi:hypothetical protein